MNTPNALNTPFSWLVRREIWEHRLALAPAARAAVITVCAVLSFLNVHHAVLDIDGADARDFVGRTHPEQFRMIAAAALVAVAAVYLALVNGLQCFYAADALYSERSQRTILFWKSLPVSDLDTVLSKLVVAMVVMPLIGLAAALETAIVLAIVVSIQYHDAPAILSPLWSPVVWGNALVVSLYVLVTSSLWFVPVVAWLLFVSAFIPVSKARLGRSPMLVAILIPVGAMFAEWILLHSTHVYHIVVGRLLFRGYPQAAFELNGDLRFEDIDATHTMSSVVAGFMTPGHFLASGQLWAGIVVSAALIAGAVYCRRLSENRA